MSVKVTRNRFGVRADNITERLVNPMDTVSHFPESLL